MPVARAKTHREKDPIAEAAADYFAARSHNAWRRKLLETNPDERGRPRQRMRGGVLVDVNQPWAKLHPKAKEDNKLAAYAAYDAIRKFPEDREAAAAHVHRAWVRRNKHDKNQPKLLFRPYAQLPEVEKDKDRAHIDNMRKAIAAVRKRMRKAPPSRKTSKTKRAPASLRFSAGDLRRIEAARRKLSRALGRPVPMEAVVMAGVEALATLSVALTAKPKSKRR
jgi:hypothetical protein